MGFKKDIYYKKIEKETPQYKSSFNVSNNEKIEKDCFYDDKK